MEIIDTRKLIALVLVIGFLAGIFGGVLIAIFFTKPGPQGPPGIQGVQGDQGPQGLQGLPGVNGTDSIVQIIQNRNSTAKDLGSYTLSRWYNISEFDGSMKITINIQQNSKIYAEFSSSNQLLAPASLRIRISVDNQLNSSNYICAVSSSSVGTLTTPGHIEFLTGPLATGQHTVDVQFLRENGTPTLLGRTLTVMEMTSP